MASPPGEFPAPRGRARHGASLVLLLALPAAFFAGYWQSEQKLAPQVAQSRVQAEQLQVRTLELEQLRRQLAVEQSGARLAQQVGEHSRQTIKQLEQQIFQLQQELATYKEVLAPGSARHGLQIRAFELQGTKDPRRFRYKVLLSRVGSAEQMLEGSLQIELRGRLKGQTEALQSIEVQPAEGLSFAFRHFQAIPEGVHFAELALPKDFEPQEVRLRATVKGRSKPLERRFSWTELQ